MAYKAGVVGAVFFMARGAVVHFHAIPRVLLETGNVPAPDVPAVLGEPIVLVRPGVLRLSNRPVARFTFQFRHLHVSGMGEKDTVRLARITEPRYFLAWFNVLLHQLGLFRVFSDSLLMAIQALCKDGYPGVAPVLPEEVTALTFSHFPHMELVVEVNGLLLL